MNLELTASVNHIFENVKTITGKDIQLIEKPDLAAYAMIKIARKNMQSHCLYYKPGYSKVINHLIAHECGHILRIFGVPEECRLVPYTNDQIKLRALSKIEVQIENLSKVIPFEKLAQVVNMWYAGLVRQLTNYPTDIMIEQWLYNDYPELRSYQAHSLKQQYDEAVVGLSSRVEAITPRKIFDASNGMNYAFFNIISTMLNDSDYLRRYERSIYRNIGSKLVLIRRSSEDNYRGDIDTINRWAEDLDISDWFAWRNFENVPDNYMSTFG